MTAQQTRSESWPELLPGLLEGMIERWPGICFKGWEFCWKKGIPLSSLIGSPPSPCRRWMGSSYPCPSVLTYFHLTFCLICSTFNLAVTCNKKCIMVNPSLMRQYENDIYWDNIVQLTLLIWYTSTKYFWICYFLDYTIYDNNIMLMNKKRVNNFFIWIKLNRIKNTFTNRTLRLFSWGQTFTLFVPAYWFVCVFWGKGTKCPHPI